MGFHHGFRLRFPLNQSIDPTAPPEGPGGRREWRGARCWCRGTTAPSIAGVFYFDILGGLNTKKIQKPRKHDKVNLGKVVG